MTTDDHCHPQRAQECNEAPEPEPRQEVSEVAPKESGNHKPGTARRDALATCLLDDLASCLPTCLPAYLPTYLLYLLATYCTYLPFLESGHAAIRTLSEPKAIAKSANKQVFSLSCLSSS